MGEKGIDPGVGSTNPGLGMAAMPGGFGAMAEASSVSQAGQQPPPPQPHGQPDPVAEVVGDILDPLGLHKLF